MKDQRNKPNNVSSEDSSAKSLHTRYQELLNLREEVRDAEVRTSEKARKSLKRDRKLDH
jgi:hypothetical protein